MTSASATAKVQMAIMQLEVVVIPVAGVERVAKWPDWYADCVVRERAGTRPPA